jgi:acetyltransferase
VVDTAFRQCGIVRVSDATTLGNDLKILRLPPMRGKNLAIMSRSGGHAVIAADACEESGLTLLEFPEDFLKEIESHFRASVIKLTNPLDLGDLFDMEVYAKIIDSTLARPEVHGMVFLHTYHARFEKQLSRELFGRVIDLSRKYDKPVALYVSTEDQEVSHLKKNLDYPVFTQVVETIRALERNRRYHATRQRLDAPEPIPSFSVEVSAARAIVRRARVEGRDLFLHEAAAVLGIYGIPIVRGIRVRSAEEAIGAAQELGFPVAMKVISAQISHKSDVGGVQLNLRSEKGVADAYRDMTDRILRAYPDAEIEGALIQPMVTGGREMILGGRQDDQFGSVVLVGFGGIFAEILDEVSLRVAPIAPRDASEMIDELRGSAILKGARGTKPSDVGSLEEMLLRLSQLLCENPEIREVDMNPVRVFRDGEGCLALDVRMILDRR